MIDTKQIRKWWCTFVGDGNFTEVRILGKFSYSGYFKSLDNLAAAIEPYTIMDDEQIYFVLNQIDDACYGRQQSEKILKSPKITTNDNDIVRRKWVMIDFDPVRKSGTNASNEEYQLAFNKARDVYYFLRQQGFPDCVICNSGNGVHLQLKVDLPNDESVTDTIKRFFQYLGLQFSDDKVEVDQKNFNLARLCKLYSTVAKKGANLPERPWRTSEIIYVPQNIECVPIEKFQCFANLVPKEEPKQAPNRGYGRSYGGGQPFDLVTWLNQHGISYKTDKQGASTRYTLEYCPWVDSHSDKKKWDSALFQDADGKITFNCQHSHCQGRTWHDFRLFYEPDAYAPKPQQYQQRQYTLPPAVQPVILPETADKGKKWFGMKDIKRVNINDIPHFLTGFKELDNAIKGLFFCEVTILSGSNSSGKSSWLNTLILNAVQQGVKVALWSGELRKDVLKTWIQMVAAGKDNLKQSQQGYYYVESYKADKIDNWLEGKFFLYNNEYSNKWAQIFNDMKELLSLGVRLFVLDNLMSMDIDIFEGDSNKKQKELISQIVDFAKKEQVHVILVAHPRKVSTFIRKTDISGSSDLTNAVDNVFIVHRVNNDFKKLGGEYLGKSYVLQFYNFGNVVEIAKNRMMGAQDKLCGFLYEIESRRFIPAHTEKNPNDSTKYIAIPDDSVIYGWRDDVGQQTSMFEQNSDMPFPGNGDDALPF